jgi:hypothetical protein
MAPEDRYQKAARNQSLFREVNERIDQLALGGEIEFICECVDLECTETIVMTRPEYSAVRENPHGFPIKPGHEDDEIERVTDRRPRYIVVEKLSTGRLVAEALDPRG